jgi:hypothetical protein
MDGVRAGRPCERKTGARRLTIRQPGWRRPGRFFGSGTKPFGSTANPTRIVAATR